MRTTVRDQVTCLGLGQLVLELQVVTPTTVLLLGLYFLLKLEKPTPKNPGSPRQFFPQGE